MRNLNECQAEVFRRSEKRIKERRRMRSRVLAWCIPLCLVIVAGTIAVTPAMLSQGMDGATQDEMEPENAMGSVSQSWGSAVEPPKTEGAVSQPPRVLLQTPEGDATLIPAGYNWTVRNSDGTATATIADQAGRPLPKDSLKPVMISSKYAETVYAPVAGSTVCEPTSSLGYLIKLTFGAAPTSVSYICWPDTVWHNGDIPEETVVSHQDHAFYAKPGGYVYEIVATWEDTGAGYYGWANYYVYIVDVDGGNP